MEKAPGGALLGQQLLRRSSRLCQYGIEHRRKRQILRGILPTEHMCCVAGHDFVGGIGAEHHGVVDPFECRRGPELDTREQNKDPKGVTVVMTGTHLRNRTRFEVEGRSEATELRHGF